MTLKPKLWTPLAICTALFITNSSWGTSPKKCIPTSASLTDSSINRTSPPRNQSSDTAAEPTSTSPAFSIQTPPKKEKRKTFHEALAMKSDQLHPPKRGRNLGPLFGSDGSSSVSQNSGLMSFPSLSAANAPLSSLCFTATPPTSISQAPALTQAPTLNASFGIFFDLQADFDQIEAASSVNHSSNDPQLSYQGVMDFKAGDFLYGLKESRARVESWLGENRELGSITIDEFNIPLFELDEIKFQLDTLDKGLTAEVLQSVYNDNNSEHESYQKRKNLFKPQDEERILRYVKFLYGHPKFSPVNGGFKSRDFHPTLIGRACKAGILFGRSEKKKIHFLLDGLDETRVVSKDAVQHKTGSPEKYLTGVELRFIFRQWKLDPSIANDVIFYKDGRIMKELPWLNEDQQIKAPWKEYSDHLDRKKNS